MTTPETPCVRHDVRFPSAAGECRRLHAPEGASEHQRVTIVVMAHGFGGIKEHRPDGFAERLVARAYAGLVFDYRHLGQSSGRPRNVVSIGTQLADWRNAVDSRPHGPRSVTVHADGCTDRSRRATVREKSRRPA